ncbi:DNA-3-methyladenine glycosylase 2 family protein [Nocardioides sp. TRM66260-LWL]|uniref:DNA-3-methyladenine glycosylase family protein n=1 Tax=Nocardioides sp. TRM66260-LWL TaxID=2874478 RepID=UPI001CC4E314|nr:DNA-3-methyladenine glycosylase 2 family protein [Nocardioides sp. TRM66260-LWL]MBZ5736297.1 DNA-3-methyladenine glycosylase 2 family protein [Nocardioides sp. TRM66260-LWL]
MSERGRERVWRPDWPVSVRGMLWTHRRGHGDPTYRIDDAGRVWRGIRTPEGVATIVYEGRPSDGTVLGRAWGPGADWALEWLPSTLGADDDPSGFEPRHPALVEAWRRHGHLRVSRSGLVWEAMLPAILEQKVTSQEAFGGFRLLVHRFGERAPGPGRDLRLWVQPSAEQVAMIPSWGWRQCHVDHARSRAAVVAARVAPALERTIDLPGAEAERRMCTLPGIGVWTAAEVRQRAHGDADAVSFGDYHVCKDVGHALAGREFDDDEMAEFLEPWRPHRGRVPVLISVAGLRRPRHGAKMAPRTHLPANVVRR